jgi:hypothetical protein
MIKKIIPAFIIFLIFSFFIYNSKTKYYEKSKEFHAGNFNGEIEKIVEGRGTKIYYENEKYFYLEDYDGVKLLVGDIIRKNNNEISVLRKNSKDEYIEIGNGKSLEPKKSYFKYFFDF